MKYQREIKFKTSESQLSGTFYPDGHRVITCNGRYVEVHADAPDEGVWIEDDDGNRRRVTVIPCPAADLA